MIVGLTDSSLGTSASTGMILVASTEFRGGDAVADAMIVGSADSSSGTPASAGTILVASTKFRGGGDVVDTQAEPMISSMANSESRAI